MKKILILLACVAMLTACHKEDDESAKYPKIYITGQNGEYVGNKSATIDERHSVDYVLSYDSVSVKCFPFKENKTIYGTADMWFTMVDGPNRVGTIDREHNRLVIGYRYLAPENRFYLDMFRTLGCAYIVNVKNFGTGMSDTIAWIPTESFIKFSTALDKYDEEGLTPEVEEMFASALVFYPCTGAEYKATQDYADLQDLIYYWNTHIQGR